MTDTHQQAPEEVVEKIKKMLDLAAKAGTPEEAAAAMAKANMFMERYNLTSESVERTAGGSGRREQTNVEGGFYAFHRELWEAMADLNFCIYWTQKYMVRGVRTSIRRHGEYIGKGITDQQKKRHCLVGRIVNVRSTIAMTGAMLAAIERITINKLNGNENNLKSNWAWSYRQGAAAQIIEKLRFRRNEREDKEEDEKRKAERKAQRSGVATATAVTLSSFKKSEEDANNDFLYGEGWSAEQQRVVMEARAKEARRHEQMEASYTAWAAANPKKARDEFSFKDEEGEFWRYSKPKRRRVSHNSRDGDIPKNADRSAFFAGYDDAKDIGLDQQMDGSSKNKRIGR